MYTVTKINSGILFSLSGVSPHIPGRMSYNSIQLSTPSDTFNCFANYFGSVYFSIGKYNIGLMLRRH